MDQTFSDLGLPPWITNQTAKLGLKSVTPIQRECIPKILDGQDCIGSAKTGSGKTFAFALPILQKLSEEPQSYFALVITPTHELAYQIAEQFLIVGQPMGLRVCVVAGGTDQMLESQRLQNRPHIIVGMPGRLADHLTGCNSFSFDNIKFLVIDEADRMLDGSFDGSLQTIESFLPKKLQTLYFTATIKAYLMTSKIVPVSHAAFIWTENTEVATVQTLDQRYHLCLGYNRDVILIGLLREYCEKNENANIMIFTNTKKECQVISMTLNDLGFKNVCLHGYMSQRERVTAFNKFKSNYVRTLVSTDVASRGLDIPNIQLVINHRLPRSSITYIHRVGRTARAGRNGTAMTILEFPNDLGTLACIEMEIKTKLIAHEIDPQIIQEIFMNVNVTKRKMELSYSTDKDLTERETNYRRVKWITNGLDPDQMEKKFNEDRANNRIQKSKPNKMNSKDELHNNGPKSKKASKSKEVKIDEEKFKKKSVSLEDNIKISSLKIRHNKKGKQKKITKS